MISAIPEPKIPENGPEPEFRPEFLRNFEPRSGSSPRNLVPVDGVVLDHCLGAIYDECWISS